MHVILLFLFLCFVLFFSLMELGFAMEKPFALLSLCLESLKFEVQISLPSLCDYIGHDGDDNLVQLVRF